MQEEIKKLRRSIDLVDAKLSFMYEQFGEMKGLFKDVVADMDGLVERAGQK